MSKVQKVITRL